MPHSLTASSSCSSSNTLLPQCARSTYSRGGADHDPLFGVTTVPSIEKATEGVGDDGGDEDGVIVGEDTGDDNPLSNGVVAGVVEGVVRVDACADGGVDVSSSSSSSSTSSSSSSSSSGSGDAGGLSKTIGSMSSRSHHAVSTRSMTTPAAQSSEDSASVMKK